MLKKIKNIIFRLRIYILSIFCLGLIWDIFFNPVLSDLVVSILIIFWVLNIFLFKFKPQVSLILSAFTYGISFIFQFFSQTLIMEKGTSWFFVFMLIALCQRIFSGRKKNG